MQSITVGAVTENFRLKIFRELFYHLRDLRFCTIFGSVLANSQIAFDKSVAETAMKMRNLAVVSSGRLSATTFSARLPTDKLL